MYYNTFHVRTFDFLFVCFENQETVNYETIARYIIISQHI